MIKLIFFLIRVLIIRISFHVEKYCKTIGFEWHTVNLRSVSENTATIGHPFMWFEKIQKIGETPIQLSSTIQRDK